MYPVFKMCFISTLHAVTEGRREGKREKEEDVMNHSKINMSSGFIIAWETHLDWRVAVRGFHLSPHPVMLGVSLLTGVDGHSNTWGCCGRNMLRAAEGHAAVLVTFLEPGKARPQGPGRAGELCLALEPCCGHRGTAMPDCCILMVTSPRGARHQVGNFGRHPFLFLIHCLTRKVRSVVWRGDNS